MTFPSIILTLAAKLSSLKRASWSEFDDVLSKITRTEDKIAKKKNNSIATNKKKIFVSFDWVEIKS